MDFSSDPSTTEYSEDEQNAQQKETPEDETPVVAKMIEEEEEDESQMEEKDKNGKILAYTLIVFVDILIPLMLILSAISCMSIMGMLFVILLYVHIFICNAVRDDFNRCKTCLIVDFVINLIVFVFAIIRYAKKIKDEWIKIVGLDFDNIISSSPNFTTATSLIAMICQIISLVLISKLSYDKKKDIQGVERFCEYRRKIFSSLGVMFGFDLVWAVCNAFNAASNCCYLYLPILLFFVISNITQSVCGRNLVPPKITLFIMAYSLLFALFELYMVSYIGEKYNPASALKYNYIAGDSTKGVNVVIAVLFAYISAQNLSAPGLSNGGAPKPVPKALKSISDWILIIAFICTFVFAMFYPNYLSVVWMLIPAIASFVKFPSLRKLLFPLLTIYFTLSFVSMALTTFYLFDPPADDGVEKRIEFCRLFGLYRYPNDFTFTACGFFIIMLLGQIGKITHVSTAQKKKKEPVIEKPLLDFEEEEELDEEELRERERLRKKEEQKKERQEKMRRMKKTMKKVWHVIYKAFSIISVAAIVIIGIAIGFYRDRFAYKILCCLFMIVVNLALYKKPVFEFIKIVSALMSMIACFYKTTINEDCLQPEDCLIYLKWDNVHDMVRTGLACPPDMPLAQFNWPIAVIFALSTFLTADPKALKLQLPAFIASAIFFIVAILHFLYVFLYETNIFSLIFLIVGIMMITSQYLQKKAILALSGCISCIFVSAQLIILLLSHFDNVRNMISSTIDESIINMTKIYGPDFEICLLAAILFCSTIAFNTGAAGKMNYFLDSVLYEIRVIMDLFYFYICWVFIFLFCIVNNNASLIKFILMLFFAFGRWSEPIFYKIRIPFLVFNILYLCAQFAMNVFNVDDNTKRYYSICQFIGLYFAAPNKPTKSERNLSVLYQLIVIILGVVNAKAYQRRITDPKFDQLLSTRIYNAICAMLHHWLDIIIQISLCTSTLFNPSLFGWFSFVVMVLVNYNEKAMQNGANAITIIFNICLIIQYLLFLGWPTEAFGYPDKKPNVVDNVHGEDNKERLRDWLRWIGVYDVKVAQLISNCISAFFFTFYLTWHNTFVDYDQRFEALPEVLKQLINWYTTYVYEIMLSLTIIVSSFVRSIDGCLFFVLSSILFLVSILMNYPKFRSLKIMSIATFAIIAARLLARLPIFTEEDIGIWIRKAFDLPLGGESKYENLWIVIYALERLTIHIMKSNIYKECIERHQMHQAFRYIRSRQLSNLEKLDQDILNQKHIIEIEEIRRMQGNIVQDVDKQNKGKSKDDQKQQPAEEEGEDFAMEPSQNNEDDEAHEEDINEMKKKMKRKSRNFFSKFLHSCGVKLIKLLAGSLHLNSEAGINVLTLDSLTTLMIKVLRTYETLKPYEPNETDRAFFESLPPSFPLHLQTIADIVDYKFVDDANYKKYLITYIFLFLRRISLPLLTFMILIYMYIKPYFFSMIVIVIFCCLILPLDIRGYPIIYEVYLALVMFLFALRNICTLDILEPYILDANDSITIKKMSISVIKMFGIDPDDTSVIEIFLFLFSVFFVVDQLQWCEIYPPKYYYDKFVKENPGFPMEYCYGIMNDPVVTLKMNQRKPVPFLKQFKYTMCKAGLIETIHSTVMLIIDTISFILLLILWGMWTHGHEESNSQDGKLKYVFLIDVPYVFILLIHVCFSLLCYSFSLSSNHIGLYITNVIWFLYTYCICNFLLYSKAGFIDSSLQFYIFCRFIWHLIAEHKCFRGRRIVAFKYPNFERDWRVILGFNKFIRICPFVFEVQTILIWMSQKTKVKLLEFFVIRDVQMQLEDAICKQTNPKFRKPAKNQKNYLKGGLLLLVFAIILFVPLFFMSVSSPNKHTNRPLIANLEIGFASYPPIFTCNGDVQSISSGIQQGIADANIKDLQFLVIANTDEVSIIDFPRISFTTFDPSPELMSYINSNIRTNTPITPFYRLTLFFDTPTTKANVNQVIYQESLPDLTPRNKSILQSMFSDDSTDLLGPFEVPLIITVATDLNPDKIDGINRRVGLELGGSTDTSSSFTLSFPDTGYTRLPVIASDDSYRIFLYSQDASESSDSLLSTDASTIGIYLLIIITLGVALRWFSLTLTDDLWIERMDNPIEVYKMSIAVNAFRAARDVDKEKEMADQLMDTLRSRELCLQITSNAAAPAK